MASIQARSHSRHSQFHAHHLRSAHSSEPAATILDHASPVELVRRETTSSSASTQTYGGNNITVPVAVGVAVPIAIALVIFLVLHRRHVKKMRLEDQNDPHKSLDFGIDPANPKRKKKGGKAQEMMQTDFEKSLRRGRGMSMDLGDISNPYVLPPGMQSSRESLHSLSRIAERGVHDPYRPATIYSAPSGSPYPSSRFDDSSSTRSGSTGPRYGRDGVNSNSNLLRNAQRMPVASPASPSNQGLEPIGEQENQISSVQPPPAAHMSPPTLKEETRDSYAGKDAQAIRQSNNYLAGFIQGQEAIIDRTSSASADRKSVSHSPPQSHSPPPVFNFSRRKHSLQRNPIPSIAIEDEPMPQGQNHVEHMPMPQDYASRTHSTLSSPTPEDSTPFYTPTEKQQDEYELQPDASGLGVSNVAFDNNSNKRLSIMRPLPPDDPTDNAEQRANRIRSFYKEYFRSDEPARAYQPNVGDYYEDYGQEYLGDGTMYDPETGKFIVAQAPFAEPVTRRAMTPPPRGPPRFQGRGSPYNSSTPSSPVVGRSRAFSTVSTGRMGPGGPRGAARRPLPPPAPLRTLPTPYLLKDDSFLTTLPIDFAPPSNFRDQAAARPQSPRGEMRPYSPQVPVASPLASSFNELPVIPSPHLLRQSSTFTSLDFAPPPRFRNDDGASDAGSIRSGRSNHSTRSAAQVNAIRAGAYRVSRIPTELVGSRNEFSESLKPTWKVGS